MWRILSAILVLSVIACEEDSVTAPPSNPPAQTVFLDSPTILSLKTASACYNIFNGHCLYRNEIQVDWAAISGAVGYRLYASLQRDSGYQLVYHTNSESPTKAYHGDTAYFRTTYYPT